MNNSFSDDGYVERRPSNLDRDAKLNYQLQVNSKRMKEKNSFNSGVYKGGLVNRSVNRSPSLEFSDSRMNSGDLDDNTFVSPALNSIEFNRKYEIEEIDPQHIQNKLRNANKKTKIQFINEGYQGDDVQSSERYKYIAKVDHESKDGNYDDGNNDMYSLKKTRKVKVFRNKSDDEDEDIEEISANENFDNKKGKSKERDENKNKNKNNNLSRSESILEEDENRENVGAIAPVTVRTGTPLTTPIDIDYTIFELLKENNSVNFILKPAPVGLVIKCHIYRKKGLYPEYRMCLQREDASLILILSAKKRKRTRTTCYGINSVSFEQNGKMSVETPFAKIKSNLFGTQFTLYDSSNDTQSIDTNGDNGNGLRKEFCAITYALNVLGFKGPRQMKVLIPAMDDNYHRKDIIVRNESESIINSWKKVEQFIDNNMKSRPGSRTNITNEDETVEIKAGDKFGESDLTSQSANVIRLTNKTPVWNQTLKSFALNFNGRVTQASVKNFQIIHPVDVDYIVMQFGKISKDVYTCDYSYPLCALQAFGICISSLDTKLACD